MLFQLIRTSLYRMNDTRTHSKLTYVFCDSTVTDVSLRSRSLPRNPQKSISATCAHASRRLKLPPNALDWRAKSQRSMALLQIRRMPSRLRNSAKPGSRPKPQIGPKTFDTRRPECVRACVATLLCVAIIRNNCAPLFARISAGGAERTTISPGCVHPSI